MANFKYEIYSTNNFKDITSIVSLFEEDLKFYSSKSFNSDLHNQNTLFYYLKRKNSIKAFFLLEIKLNFVQLQRFKWKSNIKHHDEIFKLIIKYIDTLTRELNVPLWRTIITFTLNKNIESFFSNENFKLYTRKNMILSLQKYSTNDIPQFNQFRVQTNITKFSSEIIDLIMISSKQGIDGVLYPEYSDVKELSNLFGFSTSNNHSFSDQASILLFDDEKLIGVNLITLTDGNSAFIWQLSVHPDYRRKGIGLNLMKFSIYTLKGMGKKELILTVTAGNPAELLYEKLGFSWNYDPFTILIKKY